MLLRDGDEMSKYTELFEQKKYTELLEKLEALSPRNFRNELISLANEEIRKEIDVFETLHDALTDGQWESFRWLDSSERESEYLIGKEKLTKQDYEDLRGCDF